VGFGPQKVQWRAIAAAVVILSKINLLKMIMISYNKDGNKPKKGCRKLLPE
jgi:hypothetical protein